jgi:hypothetical protein
MVVFIGNLLGTELAVRIFRIKIKYIGNGSFFLQKNPIKDKPTFVFVLQGKLSHYPVSTVGRKQVN